MAWFICAGSGLSKAVGDDLYGFEGGGAMGVPLLHSELASSCHRALAVAVVEGVSLPLTYGVLRSRLAYFK
jgi:hypothetical protein